MKLCRRHTVAAALSAAALPVHFAWGDQTKADNTNTLDSGASWASGTAPSTGDMAIWAGAYNTSGSLNTAFNASTPVSWEGIRIGATSGSQASAGLISIGGTGTAVTGSQVTLGSGGIDLSAANENLVLNTKMTSVAANQTWNIASGRNLRLAGTGTGSANAIMNGSGNILITGGGTGGTGAAGGVVDLNEGGSTGFSDSNSFATFTGNWTVNSGATLRAIRNGATAFGTGSITLNGGTLAVGGISGSQGNWTWNTAINLSSGTTSCIDEQIYSGTGRSLKLNGNITGADATANLTFKDTDAISTFTSTNLGFIVTGNTAMPAGSTITIGGPVENGISGRLTDVRIGGVNGTSTATGTGANGSLGAATVVDNGNLTFSYNNTNTISNNISGTGNVFVGGNSTGTVDSGSANQILTLNGTNTYTGWTYVAASTLNLVTPGTFSNAYTGGLTIGSSGTVNISAATVLTAIGPIAVNSGTLNLGTSLTSTGTLSLGSGSGTGTLNITAGTVNVNGLSLTSATTATANLTLSGGTLNIGSAGISAAAAGTTNLNIGAATLGAFANWSSNQNFNLTDNVNGTTFSTLDSANGTTPRTITLSGTLSGSGILNVTGTGKLYINGSDTSGGTVNVASGATLGGIGSINGPTVLASGASLEAGQSGVGTLTLNGGLTFNGSSNVNLGSPATGAAINDTGALTTEGATNSVIINISSLAGTMAGITYPLINYSGGVVAGTGFSAFKLSALPARATGSLIDTGSQIELMVTGTDFLIWTGAANLTNGWDTSTNNWKLNSNGTATAYINGPSADSVVFDDSAAPANTTVNLNTVVHPSSITFNNSTNNYTITGTGGINGSTGIMLNGTGTVTLATANSFTGPVAINSGILNLQNSAALGATPGVSVTSGATLQLQSGISVGNIPLTISGSGAVGQNGALVNSGGSNTYPGTITLAANATLSSDSGLLTLSSTSPITGNGNTLTLTGAGNGTITSPIALGGGGINVAGTGTWSLNGTNSFTGPTSITSGTLAVTNTGAFSSTSGIFLGTANSAAGNINLHIGGSVNITAPITVSDPGIGTVSINATGASTATVSGAITLSSNLVFNNSNTAMLTSAFNGGTLPGGGLNVSSGITGTGGLTFTGGGVTVLLNGTNTYTGSTTVTGNTILEYFSSNSTDPNTLLNISSGSRVLFSNSNGKFGGLTGTGLFTASTQSTNYETIGSLNDATDVFQGVIAGPLDITKTGTGMQVFAGSNTYTGATIVNGGVLQAGVATVPGVSGAFGVNTAVTVSGGTLDLNGFNNSIGSLSDGGSSSGAVTLGAATLTIAGSANASYGGTLSGTGGLVVKTSGTQTLTGTNTYTGLTNVSSGTLVITATSALPAGGNVAVNTGATLVLDSQTTASSANLLNINGNLVVHNGNLQTLTASAQQAFNDNWNGSYGLISSQAAANSTHLTALGVIQDDDGTGTGNALYTTFEGQSVSDSDVLVKYTEQSHPGQHAADRMVQWRFQLRRCDRRLGLHADRQRIQRAGGAVVC
jgi:autotransporter-associated beta strand protein